MLLFDDTASHTLLDGPYGCVQYFADAVAADTAARWFEILLAEVPWDATRRRMYERDVVVPRLTANYDLTNASLPDTIQAARRVVEQRSGHAFNSVGLNRYRDGNDSVAPHNDTLDDLAAGAPIALLSLGGVRRFVIRTKKAPLQHLDIDLAPGSVLVMSYATQVHLNHGIPKTRTPVAQRISLAFRDRLGAHGLRRAAPYKMRS